MAKPRAADPAGRIAPDIVSRFFDAAWYARKHPGCGGAAKALDHYLRVGAARRLMCSPFIDTKALAEAVGRPVEPLSFLSQHGLNWPGVINGFSDLHDRQAAFLSEITVVWPRRPGDGQARRPYLVVLQCGDPRCAVALSEPERTYDLWVNYYAADRASAANGDIVTVQPGTKFTAMQKLFADPSALAAYTHVLLLDDDIRIDPRSIDYLFRLAAYFGAAMCQASLSATSHCSFPALFSQQRYARFLNGIEVMMPVFARPFLDRLMATGPVSISGWGLDLYWASQASFGAKGDVLIFDAVVAGHERPMSVDDGAYYRMLRENGIFCETEFWDIVRNHVGDERWPGFQELTFSLPA